MLKKAQMTEAFFKILLALIIFIPTILFASKLFSATQQGSQSFEEIVQYVNNVANDPSLISDNVPLYMDEGDIMLFFNPKAEYIMTFPRDSLPIGIPAFFSRPKECGDTSCICLCREYELGDRQSAVKNIPGFPNHVDSIHPEYYTPVCDKYTCEKSDALFVSSDEVKRKVLGDAPATGFAISRMKYDSRLRTATIEKYKGHLNICFAEPCMDFNARYFLDRNEILDRLGAVYAKCDLFRDNKCVCDTIRKSKIAPQYITYETTIRPEKGAIEAVLSRGSNNVMIAVKQIPKIACTYDFDTGKVEELKTSLDLRMNSPYEFTNNDYDNDGLVNDNDEDMDNDGILNALDKDKDGDYMIEYVDVNLVSGRQVSSVDKGISEYNYVFYKVNSTHTCIGKRTSEWSVEWKSNKQYVIGKEEVRFCDSISI